MRFSSVGLAPFKNAPLFHPVAYKRRENCPKYAAKDCNDINFIECGLLPEREEKRALSKDLYHKFDGEDPKDCNIDPIQNANPSVRGTVVVGNEVACNRQQVDAVCDRV